MGETCSCDSDCCGGSQQQRRTLLNTEVKNPDWADAVLKNKMTGIRILHHDDPGLANVPIDENGTVALLHAVKHKKGKLLEYLLNNGANINAQGGTNYNSALHEAMILKDFAAIKKLYSYGIDDTLRNNQNRTAYDLCEKRMRREFTKAKQYKQKHKDQYLQKELDQLQKRHSSIMLAGMNLNDTAETSIRKYVKETDHAQNFYRRKQEEIANRDMALTEFGDLTGVEVDEIAMTVQKIPDLGRVWSKLAKRSGAITKQTEIYKILFGLTVMALRKKNPRAKKPPADQVKKLTTLLCRKLPKRKGKAVLDKELFEKDFHKKLYEIHDELVEKEEDQHY